MSTGEMGAKSIYDSNIDYILALSFMFVGYRVQYKTTTYLAFIQQHLISQSVIGLRQDFRVVVR